MQQLKQNEMIQLENGQKTKTHVTELFINYLFSIINYEGNAKV